MSSNIATEPELIEKLRCVHHYMIGVMQYDYGMMGGSLAGQSPSGIITELLVKPELWPAPSVSVETKTEDSGKPEASANHVAAVLQNTRQALRDVIAAAQTCLDNAHWEVRYGSGDLNDAMNHGLKILSEHDGGSPAVGASSQTPPPSTAPASGKFKMSIFEELLDAAQDAADFMSTAKIGSQEYEMGIRLQLAIERAAK